jgi:hypothetical protein
MSIIKKLQKLWKKFLKWLRKYDPPKPVEGVEMKNATLSWNLPTERESGGPLPTSQIEATEISMSADLGANFAVLDLVLPTDTQELLVPDLASGDWIFRLVVIDTDSRRSANVDHPFNIADETPPQVVTNVAVVLS